MVFQNIFAVFEVLRLSAKSVTFYTMITLQIMLEFYGGKEDTTELYHLSEFTYQHHHQGRQ